jgi:hypothetical protein
MRPGDRLRLGATVSLKLGPDASERRQRSVPGLKRTLTVSMRESPWSNVKPPAARRQSATRVGTGEEVANEDIVGGYKVDTDTFVEVTKDELENVALESTRTIAIDEFVDRGEIDARYLTRSIRDI